ncbi:hypothetical protein D3C76_496540 [compost metagenome]
MNWLSSYRNELELAFAEAASIMEELPEMHRQTALHFLDKFHPLKEDRSKNYICYLLPLWMHDLTEVPLNKCREFAIANVFGMLYYHIIDAVMDERDKVSTSMLPLAEFIHLEFIQHYSRTFSGTSALWEYYRKYVAEWAHAVSAENKSDYFYDNPMLMGHKAAPVKLSIIAPLLLSQREGMIPELERAVDTVLVTLQMLDDWNDWEKDLEEESYNSLVSMVHTECGISEDRRPTKEEMNHALYVKGVLTSYANRANELHNSLSYVQTAVPHLYDFHDFLRANLVTCAQNLEHEKNMLLQGGLNYFLSKNKKKS